MDAVAKQYIKNERTIPHHSFHTKAVGSQLFFTHVFVDSCYIVAVVVGLAISAFDDNVVNMLM